MFTYLFDLSLAIGLDFPSRGWHKVLGVGFGQSLMGMVSLGFVTSGTSVGKTQSLRSVTSAGLCTRLQRWVLLLANALAGLSTAAAMCGLPMGLGISETWQQGSIGGCHREREDVSFHGPVLEVTWQCFLCSHGWRSHNPPRLKDQRSHRLMQCRRLRKSMAWKYCCLLHVFWGNIVCRLHLLFS